MKKLLLIVMALILALTCVSCGSKDEEQSGNENGNGTNVSENGASEEEQASAEIIKKIMDSIGTDLAERAKAAGYSVETRIRHYKFEQPEDRTLSEREQEQAFDKIFVEVIIYSPEGSATYGNNTVDCDLLRELQYAVLEASVFGLSGEDIEEGKSIEYSVESGHHNISIKNGDVQVTTMEAPFGNRAMVQINDVNNGRLLSLYHKDDWSRYYIWDVLN